MTYLMVMANAIEPRSWEWEFAGIAAAGVVLANVLLIAVVHIGRLRRSLRTKRQKRFQAQFEQTLANLDPAARSSDPRWLRSLAGSFDELEWPIVAMRLIERMQPASEEERAATLAALREAGVVELIARPSRPWLPWRRALSMRTLGWIGADEKLPLLLASLSDRNRYVREAAVRALGRIGDTRALPMLGEAFRSPGRAGPGVVYDALVMIGDQAEPIFVGALRSPIESVRVSSCFGVAALSEPDSARRLLAPLLEDDSAAVRTAAAKSLGHVGGEQMPLTLAWASQDEEPIVRAAATAALGSFDDPEAVAVVLNALLDPDRDTAVHAGEALVRLSQRDRAAAPAAQAIEHSTDEWPVERALALVAIEGLPA